MDEAESAAVRCKSKRSKCADAFNVDVAWRSSGAAIVSGVTAPRLWSCSGTELGLFNVGLYLPLPLFFYFFFIFVFLCRGLGMTLAQQHVILTGRITGQVSNSTSIQL